MGVVEDGWAGYPVLLSRTLLGYERAVPGFEGSHQRHLALGLETKLLFLHLRWGRMPLVRTYCSASRTPVIEELYSPRKCETGNLESCSSVAVSILPLLVVPCD